MPDTALAMVGPGTAAFASTEGGTFECRFDDGAWTPCASPAPVPAGGGIVSVRAVDAAGNADPSPANVRRPAAAAAQPTGAGTFTSTGATLHLHASAPAARRSAGSTRARGRPAPRRSASTASRWGEHAFALRATFANGLTVAAPDQRWGASAPAARIAALQFPVLLHRGRGRARPRARPRAEPALRAQRRRAGEGPHRPRRGRRTKLISSWTVAPSRGDHVVRVATACSA